MVEITKQNETYQISETTEDGWSMQGNASKDTNGSLSMSFQVNKSEDLGGSDSNIGNCNYTKFSGSDRISLNYDVDESNRDKFATYIDTVIDSVLAHFSE